MKPSLKKRIREIVSVWSFIIFAAWLLSISWSSQSSSPSETQKTKADGLVAEEHLSAAQSVLQPILEPERVEVSSVTTNVPPVHPRVAFENYVIDMRNTPVEGLPQWLKATGQILNATEFQKVYFERWGLALDTKFPDQVSAPHSVYDIWIRRSVEVQFDLLGSLLEKLYLEARLDIFKHWIQLLMHHRQPDELRRVKLELKRYLDVTDRKADDFPARAKEVLNALILLGALDKSTTSEVLAIFADPEIGAAVGDAAGFTSLTMLAATLPYSEMAGKIPDLLHSSSKEVQWGTIEMIRFYVHQQQLNGELVADMIPDYLLRSADDVRCSATLELLASFGGENGRAKLLTVARDESSPRRGVALGFLAAAGRISVAEVVAFASHPSMAMPVLSALASLAGVGNLHAYREIERYLVMGDPILQREAATILLRSGRLSVEDAARYGVR
jgi:hypothetical protein